MSTASGPFWNQHAEINIGRSQARNGAENGAGARPGLVLFEGRDIAMGELLHQVE